MRAHNRCQCGPHATVDSGGKGRSTDEATWGHSLLTVLSVGGGPVTRNMHVDSIEGAADEATWGHSLFTML